MLAHVENLADAFEAGQNRVSSRRLHTHVGVAAATLHPPVVGNAEEVCQPEVGTLGGTGEQRGLERCHDTPAAVHELPQGLALRVGQGSQVGQDQEPETVDVGGIGQLVGAHQLERNTTFNQGLIHPCRSIAGGGRAARRASSGRRSATSRATTATCRWRRRCGPATTTAARRRAAATPGAALDPAPAVTTATRASGSMFFSTSPRASASRRPSRRPEPISCRDSRPRS